jgi:hypothetical protein
MEADTRSGRRSMLRVVRVVALAGLCAFGGGAGAMFVATPALATTCLPQGSTCTPDDFTGTGIIGSTLLASLSGPAAVSTTFTGKFVEAVYRETSGMLTFDLQLVNNSVSTASVQRVGASNFQGVTADMGYRADGGTLPLSPFVNGTQIPLDVSRAMSGDPIAWGFTGTSAINTLPPATTSEVLEIQTNATLFKAGSMTVATPDGTTVLAGFEPVATTVSSTANPSSAFVGTKLQDSATLSGTSSLDGSGSVTFTLYGPGDPACTTPLDTETVTGITTNGPFSTTTGYVATTAGTYNWVATFSGDTKNQPGSTGCGAEPVQVQVARGSEITPRSTTCAQFAGPTSPALSKLQYTVANRKIKSVNPSGFSYWDAVTSSGGTQTVTIQQFVNETSRPFLLGSGSTAYTSGCSKVASVIKQSGGAVTVSFNGGTVGTIFYIGLNFSSSNVVGEHKPGPSTTVQYLFKSPTSTTQVNLAK